MSEGRKKLKEGLDEIIKEAESETPEQRKKELDECEPHWHVETMKDAGFKLNEDFEWEWNLTEEQYKELVGGLKNE